MIERVAGCLETGGQHLLRVQKKAFRSRRSLHSGFWCHGALDIDLPSWWMALLQVPQGREEQRCPQRSSSAANNLAYGIIEPGFLEFLYPAHTLASIQRFVKTRANVKSRRLARKILQYSRAYTSIASQAVSAQILHSPQSSVGSDESWEGEWDDSSPPEAIPEFSKDLGYVYKEFCTLLEEGGNALRQSELWQRYQNLRSLHQEPTAKQMVKLLKYLGASHKTIDAARVVAVVSGIPIESREGIHYTQIIWAALRQDDVKSAVAFHSEALSRIQGTIGTASLLCYFVEREMWKSAVETWYEYLGYRQPAFDCLEMWHGVEALPLSTLMKKAYSIADFAIALSADAPTETTTAVRDFALQMIIRAFNIRSAQLDFPKHHELFEIAVRLKEPSHELFKAAICQLLHVNEDYARKKARRLYLRMRMHKGIFPDKPLLGALFNRFRSDTKSKDMLMVLDDYRKYTQGPPLWVLYGAMGEFSRQGNIRIVWDLFHEFVSKFGNPRNGRVYGLILSTYCKRLELNKVIYYFRKLQDDYGFKPDIQAWNALIAAHARAGDIDGAQKWFNRMLQSGPKANSYTYSYLMSMYARQGDSESVNRILQLSQSAGLKPSIPMIDSLVMVLLKNDQLDAANKLVDEALQLDVEGSRTRMWNFLLNAYAMRQDIHKVTELHQRMRENSVQPDEMTYAALMHSLQNHPGATWKILRRVFVQVGVRPSPIHYEICMSAYLRSKNYDKVFEVFSHMQKKGIMPAFSTRKILITAAVNIDIRRNSNDETGQSVEKGLILSEELLNKLLVTTDPIEFALGKPLKIKNLGPNRLEEAYVSGHFVDIIRTYGRLKRFDKVAELFARYTETAEKFANKFQQGGSIDPPLEMVSALMEASLEARDYDAVNNWWNLALDNANKLVRRPSFENSEPRLVLYPYRFIINAPLASYIRSLEEQEKIDLLITTIDDLRELGYMLDNRSWNKYIQVLARHGWDTLAFKLCERELMAEWAGWAALGITPVLQIERLQESMPKITQRPKGMASYKTLIYLTKIYLQLRSEGSPTFDILCRVAPQTVDAVRNMPMVDDHLQLTILRPD
ncbi:hypothetical protein MMC31_003806 [Peltigera leucophlebia]|nr:hypothetical protein [Peltigera leucophlebia]